MKNCSQVSKVVSLQSGSSAPWECRAEAYEGRWLKGVLGPISGPVFLQTKTTFLVLGLIFGKKMQYPIFHLFVHFLTQIHTATFGTE